MNVPLVVEDYKPSWGPWAGVPEDQRRLCAVEGCADPGAPRICLYDGRLHHHGCIHYDCSAAVESGHGLRFRDGWGYICDPHYKILESALAAALERRASDAKIS